MQIASYMYSKSRIRSYSFGFNGKEKLNEQYGEGNAYDFGARMYDPRIGRWQAKDPLEIKYVGNSPYSFAANSPLMNIDPDGRLIIFINGYYGWPTNATGGGTVDYWGVDWVNAVKTRIGDPNAIFVDGSMGGKNGLVNMWTGSNNKSSVRKDAGFKAGMAQAADIINSLERDADGNIIESIKYVTSSMGAAYQRGFSKAVKQYVKEQNQIIDAVNLVNEVLGIPGKLKRLDVKQEFVVDLDAYQGGSLSKDPSVDASKQMVSDGANDSWYEDVGSKIPGEDQIGLDKNGKTEMHGHHPSNAPTLAFPKSTMNGKERGGKKLAGGTDDKKN